MSSLKVFTARHRFAHITARKARYVADLIRGRGVNEALELLQFTPNRGATFYGKVLRSAIANASQDEHVNINRLVVSHCTADDGPLLQGRMRYRPGPQGRAMPFARRLSHLTVRISELATEGARKRGSIEEPADEAKKAPAEADHGHDPDHERKPRAASKSKKKSKQKATGSKASSAAKKPARAAKKKTGKSTAKGSEEKKA